MAPSIREVAALLARDPEAVCRHYLFNGRKHGRYWLVGNADNMPGQSLYVRLTGPEHGPGAAGKWSDAATGEHGDLLDLIRRRENLPTLTHARDAALRFMGATPLPPLRIAAIGPPNADAPRRLFRSAVPVRGTLAETYLLARGLTGVSDEPALRFHGQCYYRPTRAHPLLQKPALLAAVRDNAGSITGVLRTYLADDGRTKANVDSPRLAMGHLLGHGARLGAVNDVLIAGEGLETMLTLRMLLPHLPAVACLSANHLRAFIWPTGVTRLYVAADTGRDGIAAASSLAHRAGSHGVATRLLLPDDAHWNADLARNGPEATTVCLRRQLDPADRIPSRA